MNKSGTFETPLNTKVPPENKAIGEGDITDLTQKRYEQDTRWRSRLSRWVIIIDSAWLCAIIVILWFNDGCFKLSDNVLMVLLGTTTINVLGLAHIILKGLFRAEAE